MPKPSTLISATSASSISANETRPTVTARTRLREAELDDAAGHLHGTDQHRDRHGLRGR
jgi:hypothetical protein